MSVVPFGQSATYPSLTLEAGFASASTGFGVWDDGGSIWNTAKWGPDIVWTDISAYIQRISTHRAFNRETGQATVGTMSVELRNDDGRFTPANLTGPYVAAGVSQVRARVPIRLRATWSSTTYNLFRGRAATWEDTYPGVGSDCVAILEVEDLFADLGAIKLAETASAGAGDYAGARIRRVLNAAGWVGDVELDVGVTTMQATVLGDSVANLARLTADSDGGLVFVDGAGAVVYQDYNRPFTGTRSVNAQITLPTDIGFDQLIPANDAVAVRNKVRYTRVGGTVQTSSDSTSIALLGELTEERTDLICETDAQALQLADLKVLLTKDPEYRVASLRVTPARSPTLAWPLVLAAKFRDRHPVTWTHPGGFSVTRECHVSGIGHEITMEDGWRVTFEYSSATVYSTYWGDANWDQATWNSGTWFI